MMNDTNLLVFFSNKMITLSTLRNDMNAHATMIVPFPMGFLFSLAELECFGVIFWKRCTKKLKMKSRNEKNKNLF